KAAIDDLITSFGDRYREGHLFQNRWEKLKTACDDLRRRNSVDEQAIQQVRTSFLELQQEALLANPLLDFDTLLYVERKEPKLGLPANWESHLVFPRRAMTTGYA
ncbi:MAG TPA: hypothetical protein PL064_14485, partial [Thermogutta sp.]|nr:hypothetical protein [Thermogutta sp.]